MNVNVIQKVEEGVERTAIPPLAATHGSEVEPLKSVEWQFPLGGCHARLTIVAAPENEIQPEDMDALREMAALIKRQLERRSAKQSPLPVKSVATSYGVSNSESGHQLVGETLPPNNDSATPVAYPKPGL